MLQSANCSVLRFSIKQDQDFYLSDFDLKQIRNRFEELGYNLELTEELQCYLSLNRFRDLNDYLGKAATRVIGCENAYEFIKMFVNLLENSGHRVRPDPEMEPIGYSPAVDLQLFLGLVVKMVLMPSCREECLLCINNHKTNRGLTLFVWRKLVQV